jgi:hypothetical protein
MTVYVKIRSWHIEVDGQRHHTLCGLTVRDHPEEGEHQAGGWSETLPPGKSCESCLRALARIPQDETIGGGQG